MKENYHIGVVLDDNMKVLSHIPWDNIVDIENFVNNFLISVPATFLRGIFFNSKNVGFKVCINTEDIFYVNKGYNKVFVF